MIIIEEVFSDNATASTITLHGVKIKTGCVLAVFTSGNQISVGTWTASINGDSIPVIASIIKNNNIGSAILYLNNPPIGTYDVTVSNTSTNDMYASVVVLSGVNQKISTPMSVTFAPSVPTSSINMAIAPAKANSLIMDCLVVGATTAWTPDASQTRFYRQTNGGQSDEMNCSYKVTSDAPQNMIWTGSGGPNQAMCAIILEPDQAPSIWFPNVSSRNIYDVVRTSGLDINTAVTRSDFGFFPEAFWHKSFLHTVGRIFDPTQASTPNPAGIIPVTSQIIVDKIFQGQVGGGTALALSVSIPSPDSTLVVTGGSVIATGGAWLDVNLNGTTLTRLVSAAVANADAEIWWLPNPPTGTYTLNITPTAVTGQVYANAMVLLGVDKKSVNIKVASATDAASTTNVSTTVTPDASNALIISTLSSLDATQRPIPDASQVIVNNPPSINASEYCITTYELESAYDPAVQTFNLGAAVNASVVSAVFRPAQYASMWFPNIDLRSLNDIVMTNGLDAGVNPANGSYGYKGSNFFLNSFLHTIGRIIPAPASISNIALRMMMGMGF